MVARPCDESPDDGRAFGRLRDRVEREKGFQRPAGTAAETVVALGEVRTGVAALERVHVCGLNATSKMRSEERLALTPSLSPRRGGSTHRSRDFHGLWCCLASWGLTSAATSRDNRGDCFAAVDRGAFVPAIVQEGQLLVIEAEQLQDGGMNGVDVRPAFDRPHANFVGRAIDS